MKLNEVLGAAKLTPEEVRLIIQARQTGSPDFDQLVDMMYDKLFEIFMNSGEMPYGTMKARTGDPYEWIASKLEGMSEFEFTQFLKNHSDAAPRERMSRPAVARFKPTGA